MIPADILLVEDDVDDIELTKQALLKAKVLNPIVVVHDGVNALKYLRQEAPYEGVAEPDLVLLDLRMPRKNGFEVLAELDTDDNLKHIPVIVLTTSGSDEDRLEAYRQGARAYVQKPVRAAEFRKAVESLVDFWFVVAKRPPKVNVL